MRLPGAACEISQLYAISPAGGKPAAFGRQDLVLGAPGYALSGRSIAAVGAAGTGLVILTAGGRTARSIPVHGISTSPEGLLAPSWQPLKS